MKGQFKSFFLFNFQLGLDLCSSYHGINLPLLLRRPKKDSSLSSFRSDSTLMSCLTSISAEEFKTNGYLLYISISLNLFVLCYLYFNSFILLCFTLSTIFSVFILFLSKKSLNAIFYSTTGSTTTTSNNLIHTHADGLH